MKENVNHNKVIMRESDLMGRFDVSMRPDCMKQL